MALASAQPHESRLYYEFSLFYDLLFRRVFYPRIATVIRSLGIEPGARVLELGVGTGLSLDAYPSHCQVTGIDLAPDWTMKSRRGLAIWAHCVVITMVSLRTLSVPAKVHFVPSADGELETMLRPFELVPWSEFL